ncbi:MAG TPA: inorganic diphosphatase, partial [Gemmatimonadota bacterium]|nr:inorganic diphosphatase [Gemmatimonadota bacterium]
ELRPHRLAQLKRFFEDYKKLEEKEVRVEEFSGPDEAVRKVSEAIERYADRFPGSW